MKKWIYGFMFLVGGALSAAMGLPVLGIYVGALALGLFLFWLIRKGLKVLPKKTFDTVNKMANKHLQEDSNGEPYVTTHHGPEGIKGLEIGFDDEEDGQPGAGRFNPTEVTLGLVEMRTAEAQAKIAEARAAIINSDSPFYLKEIALKQIQPEKLPSTQTTKPPMRRRRKGEDFVGMNYEGNYSISD